MALDIPDLDLALDDPLTFDFFGFDFDFRGETIIIHFP